MPEGPFGAGGVNWSFECVGHPAVTAQAVQVLDWGGVCVQVGVPAPGVTYDIPITHLTQVDRGIIGSRAGGVRAQRDIPVIVDLYKKGLLDLDPMVSKTYPMEQFHTVVEDMHGGTLARASSPSPDVAEPCRVAAEPGQSERDGIIDTHGSILGTRLLWFEGPKFLTTGGDTSPTSTCLAPLTSPTCGPPAAHARIVSIDTTEAAQAPGVVAVFTAAELAAGGLAPFPPALGVPRPGAGSSGHGRRRGSFRR